MKGKTLILALLLITATIAITITATVSMSTLSNTLNTITDLDIGSILLDGDFTTNGGGDPVPGGGIPK